MLLSKVLFWIVSVFGSRAVEESEIKLLRLVLLVKEELSMKISTSMEKLSNESPPEIIVPATRTVSPVMLFPSKLLLMKETVERLPPTTPVSSPTVLENPEKVRPSN